MQARADIVFRSLSDPTRRAIFERLCCEGELTVWQLTEAARVSQPAVSKHLGQLKSAGLVRDRRQGRETHYSAEPKALKPLLEWLGFYVAFWREKFDAL